MARTWNCGYGAQCGKTVKGTDKRPFCGMHLKGDAWQTHGRVDGPIPAGKLKEFEDFESDRNDRAFGCESEKYLHAQQRKEDIRASKPESLLEQDRTARAGQQDRRERHTAPPGRRGSTAPAPREGPKATQLFRKEKLEAMEAEAIAELVAKPPTTLRLHAYFTSWSATEKGKAALAALRAGRLKKSVFICEMLKRQEKELRRAEAAEDLPKATYTAAFKQGARPGQSDPWDDAAAAAAASARPAKKPRRPNVGSSSPKKERKERKDKYMQRAKDVDDISSWARQQVHRVLDEITILPRSEQKSALKRRAASFHSDKLPILRRREPLFAARSDDELREVFEALMRIRKKGG